MTIAFKKNIINFVKNNPLSSIEDISLGLKLNRMTISKYVAVLQAEGKIKVLIKGTCKLFTLTNEVWVSKE